MFNQVNTTVELNRTDSVALSGTPRTAGVKMTVTRVGEDGRLTQVEVSVSNEAIRTLVNALEQYR